MRRLLAFAMLLWLRVGLLTLALPAVGAAQQDVAMADRRPRFLIPAASRGAAPTEVDAGRVPLLRRKVSLNLRDVRLEDALGTVARQAGVRLVYVKSILPVDSLVRFRSDQITVAAALTELLLGSNVDVLISGAQQVVLVRSTRRPVATGSVTGRVTDANTGGSVVGAEVFLDGTRWRTATDSGGRYRLAGVDSGTYTLTARRLGYKKQSKKVVVHENQEDTADVVLAPVAAKLNELVTTATGRQRRRDLGNAITTIKADSVLQDAPVHSLTELLQSRVPGLTVQHTSGAPGDPSKLRLRGLNSALRSNDPVVVVDGVRVYAAQAEARSGNLTNLASGIGGGLPAPSPLDQIDPNTIEKIEVFKGASAATLYGADAANGVIVITTKKGRPGPTRWSANITRGQESSLGRYPTGYFRWGHDIFSATPRFCTLIDLSCAPDSLVQFQALNDPDFTMLGHGQQTTVSLTASGGTQTLTYSVTGSYSDQIGLLSLPQYEVNRFANTFGRAAPDWMRHPHRYETWGVTSSVTARLGATADVTLMSSLVRSEQQRTDLESQIAALAGTYIDAMNGRYYRPAGGNTLTLTDPTAALLNNYYTRTTASTLTVTTGLSAGWRPRSWFNATAQAGLNVVPRNDQRFRPTYIVTGNDSGAVARGSGRSLVSTMNLQGTLRKPIGLGFVFETNVGANVNTSSTEDLATSAFGLVAGTNGVGGARRVIVADATSSQSSYGWYIEPRVTGQRLSLSAGLRLDGGSANGGRLSGAAARSGNLFSLRNLLALPKLNGSWVISDEPFFPFKSLFSSLRLRGAYGQAQVQPGPADRLRLYDNTVELTTLGNTQLRPERSTEIEGGFDADLLDSRLSVELTGYHRMQVDALMNVELPGSVNGGNSSVVKNIGNILNRGLEFTLRMTPVQRSALTWTAELYVARNYNELTKLGRGVEPDPGAGLVAGYPVRGRWAKPILGFADQNSDNVIQLNEIMIGDSAVFVGRLQPAYTSAVHTSVGLLGGALRVTGGFTYDHGGTQLDQTAIDNWVLARALVDPGAPASQQAAVVAYVATNLSNAGGTDYGVIQNVSTFRFNSLSVNYRVPGPVVRALRAQQVHIAVQGANLALHSTYRGKDPNVNAWTPGEGIVDGGQLPQPRTWQLRVDLTY